MTKIKKFAKLIGRKVLRNDERAKRRALEDLSRRAYDIERRMTRLSRDMSEITRFILDNESAADQLPTWFMKKYGWAFSSRNSTYADSRFNILMHIFEEVEMYCSIFRDMEILFSSDTDNSSILSISKQYSGMRMSFILMSRQCQYVEYATKRLMYRINEIKHRDTWLSEINSNGCSIVMMTSMINLRFKKYPTEKFMKMISADRSATNHVNAGKN